MKAFRVKQKRTKVQTGKNARESVKKKQLYSMDDNNCLKIGLDYTKNGEKGVDKKFASPIHNSSKKPMNEGAAGCGDW